MGDEDDAPRARLDVDPRGHGSSAVAPPTDDLFAALADRTRRRVLWFLLEERHTTVDELADVLVGWDVSGAGIAGPPERDRVLVSLRHVHLPKLDEAGLVSHDPDDREVRLAPVSDPVRDLVRFGHRYEPTTDAGGPG